MKKLFQALVVVLIKAIIANLCRQTLLAEEGTQKKKPKESGSMISIMR
jgi:hypothetical protein